MNIVIGCSKEYAKYAMVMIQSLFDSNANYFISLYVMIEGELGEWKEKIEHLVKKNRNYIQFITLPLNNREEEIKKFWSSTSTIDRWRAIEFLPENIERFLMLDVDIIVKGDLWELYNFDFEDKYIIVCRDIWASMFCNSDTEEWIVTLREYYKLKELDKEYGNFGVVLINRNIKKVFCYSNMINTIIENRYRCVDQDYFNLNMKEYIKFIEPYKYNYLTVGGNYEKVIDNVRIVHFAGGKPWETYGQKSWITYERNPWIKMWFEYARRVKECEEVTQDYEKYIRWKNNLLYCNLLHHWMDVRAAGGTVFDNYEYSSIALYGAGRMCRHLLIDLEQTMIQCRGIYDRDILVNEINGRNICHDLEKYLNKIKKADVIIVTAIMFYEEIKFFLEKKTDIKIVSLEEIIRGS